MHSLGITCGYGGCIPVDTLLFLHQQRSWCSSLVYKLGCYTPFFRRIVRMLSSPEKFGLTPSTAWFSPQSTRPIISCHPSRKELFVNGELSQKGAL